LDNLVKILVFLLMNGLFFLLWKNKDKLGLKTFIGLNIVYIILTNKYIDFYIIDLVKSLLSKEFISVESDEFVDYITKVGTELNSILKLDSLLARREELPVKAVLWGLIGFITAIYIYIRGVSNQVKRNILTHLVGHGKMFYLGFTLCTALLLGGNPSLLIGGSLFLIYILFDSVRWMSVVDNPLQFYDQKQFNKILLECCGDDKVIFNLLSDSKHQLMTSLSNSDFITFQNTYKVFKFEYQYFSQNYDGNEASSFNGYGLYQFTTTIYDLAQSKSNEPFFLEIQDIHLLIAEHFYSLGNYQLFGDYLSLFYRNYEQYHKTKKEGFIRAPFRTVERFIDKIYKSDEDNQGINSAQIAIYKSLHETIKIIIKNKDYKFLAELLGLSSNRDVYGFKEDVFTNHHSFYMTEYCFLWGVLVYLESLNGDETVYTEEAFNLTSDKINAKLNEHCLTVNLIEIYDFIRKNDIPEKMAWNRYFTPKIPISGGASWSRKDDEVEVVLLKLLGKFGAPYDYTPSSEDLSSFHQNIYLFKSLLNDETKHFDNKSGLISFIDGQYQMEAKQRERLINEEPLNEEKISETKSIIKNTLEDNRLLKYLKKLGKYQCLDENGPETANTLGFNSLLPKDMFVKTIGGQSIGFERIVKDLADELNNVVSKVFIDPIEQKASVSCEALSDAVSQLKSVQGQTVIFLSKMSLYPSLLKEGQYIKSKASLNSVTSNKYDDLIEGVYNDGKNNAPIFYIRGSFKGAYIFKINTVDKFIHYKEKHNAKSELISFASFRLCDVSTPILAKKSFGPDLGSKDTERFKGKVAFELFQKGELYLSDSKSEIYKIEYSKLVN